MPGQTQQPTEFQARQDFLTRAAQYIPFVGSVVNEIARRRVENQMVEQELQELHKQLGITPR